MAVSGSLVMKRRATMSRKRAAQKIQSAYRSYKSKTPSRFAYSRKRYARNNQIVNTIKKFSELKISPITPQDEVIPQPIQLGAQSYYINYVLGNNAPGTWTNYTPLGGMTWATGDGGQNRNGRYMYLNKTTLNMNIQMNQSGRNKAPTIFRVIVFKMRRAMSPAGLTYNPSSTLFLENDGFNSGQDLPGFNGADIDLLALNKRDYIIYRDMRFTLQAPMASTTGETASFQGKYPNYKRIMCSLPHRVKAVFSQQTDEPQDYDFHWGISILATSVGRDSVADGWEVNMRGLSSAYDN